VKYIDNGHIPIIELTRRNLEVLLAKLDETPGDAMLVTGKGAYDHAAVRAVEDEEHYSDRAPDGLVIQMLFKSLTLP
jgi:isopentenyl phosphate kinase